MSKFIHKSHKVTILLYHIVCPAKYRKIIFDDEEIEIELRNICIDISNRYEINFLEIGVDMDHVHFLVQSIPMFSLKRVVQIIKSITAKQMFLRKPMVKKKLWGGEFWTKGYFASTVGRYASEETILEYVKNQGKKKEYKQIYKGQLTFW